MKDNLKITTVSKSGQWSGAKFLAAVYVNSFPHKDALEGNNQIAVQVNDPNSKKTTLINVTFADGSVWSGDFADLKERLIGVDIKTQEKIAEMRTRPVSKTLSKPQ